jgi:hypothetical protein
MEQGTQTKVVGALFAAAAIAAIWWTFKSTSTTAKSLSGVRKPKGNVISKTTAKEIANDWHSGSSSPLYSLASTGDYRDDKYKDYLKEISDSEVYAKSSDQKAQLKKLSKWVDYKHWEEHA